MRRLYIPLTRDEADRLSKLAQAERRRPQDQAALLLAQALATLPPAYAIPTTIHAEVVPTDDREPVPAGAGVRP